VKTEGPDRMANKILLEQWVKKLPEEKRQDMETCKSELMTLVLKNGDLGLAALGFVASELLETL
jgi:hypothetical protein